MSFLSIPLRRAVLNAPKCLRAPIITTITPRAFSTTPTPLASLDVAPKKARKVRRKGPPPLAEAPFPFEDLSFDFPPAPEAIPKADPRAHDFIKFMAANLGYTNNPKAKTTVVVGGECAEQEPWIVKLAVKVAKLYGVQNLVVGKDGRLSARRANKIKKDLAGNGCILIVKKTQGKKKNPVLDENGKMVPNVEVNMCYAHFNTWDDLLDRPNYHAALNETMPALETAVHSLPSMDISTLGNFTYFGMSVSVVEGDHAVKLRRMTREMQAAHKKEKDRLPGGGGSTAMWMGRGSKAGVKRYADKTTSEYDMSKPPSFNERSLKGLLNQKKEGTGAAAAAESPRGEGQGLKGLLEIKRAQFFSDKRV